MKILALISIICGVINVLYIGLIFTILFAFGFIVLYCTTPKRIELILSLVLIGLELKLYAII